MPAAKEQILQIISENNIITAAQKQMQLRFYRELCMKQGPVFLHGESADLGERKIT